MTIEEVVRKVLLDEHADVLREAAKAVAQELMELEVSELVGAERGERRPGDRATHRNGYRPRRWDTRAGEIELQIPKIRQGSYFPSILEPRRRSEQALLSVVQQAYVCGVSTRRVDQLVESLGLRISRSEVSRVCEALDEHVDAFRNRPLEGRYPYLFLDAKVEKVRDGGRVVAKALVVAHGVHETGRREILSIDVGEAETEAFWTEFLRGLVARGLVGVQLAISDAHAGLKAAIAKILGCAWQRCTVHFLRDCLGHARKDQHGLLAAVIRPIFNAENAEQARDRLSEAVAHLERRMPRSRHCSRAPRRRSWPSTRSPRITGPSCAPPTRLSASTARSAAAPTSWASSPTTAASSAWPGCSASSKTTNGSSGAATYPPNPWRNSSATTTRPSTRR
jgi:transposase-like protein